MPQDKETSVIESGRKTKMLQKRKKDAEDEQTFKGRLPLLGATGKRNPARPALSAPQARPKMKSRKRVSVATKSMTPWEGSSHSESSLTAFPAPPSSRPLPHTKTIPAADAQPPPLPAPPEGVRVRHKPLPLRGPPRPPRLPPLRQVTNLSFSRSFTFSFFELPLHQSARSRTERLRDLVVLLKQFRY